MNLFFLPLRGSRNKLWTQPCRLNLILCMCWQTLPKMHLILNHSVILVVLVEDVAEIRSGQETSGHLLSPHKQFYFIFKLCLQPTLDQVTSHEAINQTLCGFLSNLVGIPSPRKKLWCVKSVNLELIVVLNEMCREYQSYDSSSSGDVDVTDFPL